MHLVIALCLASVAITTGYIAKRNVPEIPAGEILPITGPEEDQFWKILTDEEQHWMMNSSVVLYLHTGGGGGNTQPLVTLNMPTSLGPKILNGNIPEAFQTKMVTWIKDTIGIEDEDLALLANGREVCGTKICSGYPGMGESCCPFG